MYWIYYLMSCIFITTAITFMVVAKKENVRYIFLYVLIIGVFGVYMTCADQEYKKGQTDALKGKFEYEQQIRTTLNDKNEIISRDTIYISVK